MKNLIIVYTVILGLGIASMLTGIHYFANIAGFISAMGFLVVFFKDKEDETKLSLAEISLIKKMRQRWYIVFGTGIFFSLIFGTLWNNQMGGMA